MRSRILIGAGIAVLAGSLSWWVLLRSTTSEVPLVALSNQLDKTWRATESSAAPSGVHVQAHSALVDGDSVWQTDLKGLVVTPSAMPAAAAEVFAWLASGDADSCRAEVGTSLQRVVANAQGEFELRLNEEEVYCVHARHPEWANSVPQRIEFEATNVRELRLLLQAVFQVAGRVMDATSVPVAGVTLQLTSRNSPVQTEYRTVADVNGNFIFAHVGPGDYDLASVDERYAVSHPQQIAMNANQPLDNLIVTIHSLVWIRGQVFNSSGKPIADAQVTARSPYSEELFLGRAQTNANGEFRLASEHRSPKATIAQRMLERGVVNAQGNERRMQLQNPTRVCLEVSHGQWGNVVVSVMPGEESFDVAPFILSGRNAAVSGVLVDRNRQPMQAQLQFKQVVDARQEAPGDCELLPAMRSTTADRQGKFSVQLPAAGWYEVDVSVSGNSTQTVMVEVGGRELRIALD